MSEFITVASVGDIPNQEGRAFKFGDTTIAIFNDNGEFRAIDDMCPHAGASLAGGFFEDGTVTCPWHAWRFNVCDGTFCDYPRLKVEVYDVQVVGDKIQVSKRPRTVDSAAVSESDTKKHKASDGNSPEVNPNG